MLLLPSPPEYHGYSGPIVLQDRAETPLADTFVKAAEEVGYKALDFNGPNHEGMLQMHCDPVRQTLFSQF